MKDLRPRRGRRYILDLIAEGEHEHQDFKHSISDACKIARSVSAFANRGGGRLLIGVKDNGTIAGVRNDEDIYVVEQAAQMYCRPAQHVGFEAFSVEAGSIVIQASIEQAPRRPVQARDSDGHWRAYYRVDDENIRAHALMVAAWRINASGKGGLVLGADADERGLLQLIARSGEAGIEPEAVAPALGMSRTRAAGIIARLASHGIIEFAFRADRRRFVVRTPAE